MANDDGFQVVIPSLGYDTRAMPEFQRGYRYRAPAESDDERAARTGIYRDADGARVIRCGAGA